MYFLVRSYVGACEMDLRSLKNSWLQRAEYEETIGLIKGTSPHNQTQFKKLL